MPHVFAAFSDPAPPVVIGDVVGDEPAGSHGSSGSGYATSACYQLHPEDRDLGRRVC
jgi:hypothetical protein